MSIASAIQTKQQQVADAYTACNGKGATMPATQDLTNLASCVSSIPTATEPTLASLTVTPSTTAQTLTVPSGVDGYNTVQVSAVTASIDSDIVAGNIKSGCNILGVSGTVTELVGSTTTITTNGTYTPSGSSNGFTSVSVNVSGTVPSGTYTITANGTYDVTNYASADVSVSGGTGITREVSANGVYQMPATSFTFSLPSNATDIGGYAMYYAFRGCTGLTSVDLSSLTTISGSNAMQYAFQNCTGLTSVDLSSLTTVSGNFAMHTAFKDCTGLTSVDLSSLTTISGSSTMYYAFQNCTSLTSVDLSSLTTISGSSAMYYAFSGCTGVTSVDLSSLTMVNASDAMDLVFYGCTGLTSVDLSSLTTISGSNAMYSAFQGCTSLTSVDLSSLTTISGSNAMYSAFANCAGLTSVLFTNLETIGANTSPGDYSQFTDCFYNCTNLTSITFPNLEKIYCTGGTTTSYGTFAKNNKVQKMYFPKLDTITYGSGASSSNRNACKNIFYGCSALTELHFGAANQSAIEATAGYSTAWGRGAGNVTIYFDL